jgi:hypothetical protein
VNDRGHASESVNELSTLGVQAICANICQDRDAAGAGDCLGMALAQ